MLILQEYVTAGDAGIIPAYAAKTQITWTWQKNSQSAIYRSAWKQGLNTKKKTQKQTPTPKLKQRQRKNYTESYGHVVISEPLNESDSL